MWLLEEVGVLCDVALHLLWYLVLGVDSLDWALRLAGAAVYVLLGVYEELIPSVVDAVDRTDLDTGLVLGAYAGLRDHVGHLFCLLSPGTYRFLFSPSLYLLRPRVDNPTSTVVTATEDVVTRACELGKFECGEIPMRDSDKSARRVFRRLLALLSPRGLAYLEKYAPPSVLHNYARGSFFILPSCVHFEVLAINKLWASSPDTSIISV